MPLTITGAKRAQAVASVQAFFRDERDEAIGELAAGFLVDFVVAEIGPLLYNRGVADVQARLATLVSEIDADVHEAEFSAGARRGRGRG